jgi:hypothetical protein
MDEALRVGSREPGGKLGAEANDFVELQRTGCEFGVQSYSGYVLRDQEVSVFFLTEFEDGCNIGVIQAGEGKSFFTKTFAGILFGEQTRRQNLDRHLAFQLFVMGSVDNAHAARAYLGKNAVVGYLLADHHKGLDAVYVPRVPRSTGSAECLTAYVQLRKFPLYDLFMDFLDELYAPSC